MIPYRDHNPTSTFPFVTLALLGANVAAFVWSLGRGDFVATLCTWGFVAADVTGAVPQGGPYACPPGGAPVFMSAFTHMFLHGGFLHLGGNMLYLWIFGNNIEDTLGHVRFLLFYVLCGLGALFLQVVTHPAMEVPMVGASGAIAGVLGAYMILFPLVRVSVLVPIFVFLTTIQVPAVLMLLFWFALQVLSGMAEPASAAGGVAWFAHIGGFGAGVLLIFIFPKARRVRRKRQF